MKKRIRRIIKAITKLDRRIDTAEYKITDLLEVTHQLIDAQPEAHVPQSEKEVLHDKLNRMYDDPDPDEDVAFTLEFSTDEYKRLLDGEALVLGGCKVQYVGDQA